MDKDIRWKQRFDNFESALTFLKNSVSIDKPSDLEKAGIVQSFEFTFELAWKTMKDFLNEKGVDVVYPRDVIKEAFRSGLIVKGEIWMDMLDSRNLMSHTYRREDSNVVFKEIVNRYTNELGQLYKTLENK